MSIRTKAPEDFQPMLGLSYVCVVSSGRCRTVVSYSSGDVMSREGGI